MIGTGSALPLLHPESLFGQDSQANLEDQVRDASKKLNEHYKALDHQPYLVSKGTGGFPWRQLRAEYSHVYDGKGIDIVEHLLSFKPKKITKVRQGPFNAAEFKIDKDGNMKDGWIQSGKYLCTLQSQPIGVMNAYVLAVKGL